MMKALVAVKRVIDYAVKVRVDPKRQAVKTDGVKFSINPFCEIAVECGVALKERGRLKELVAVSAGGSKCQDTLRQALAMGADKAILLQTALRTDSQLQPLAVAKLLHWAALREKPSLVLLGKQAIDDDSNQTGQLLAGLLRWPQATFASKVELSDDGKAVEVTREVDDGLQTVTMPLPAVVTCDLRLNTPRYATLPNLMKAKKKPLEVLEVDKTGVDVVPRLDLVRMEEPPKRSGGKILDGVDELIEKLKNEAQVIV